MANTLDKSGIINGQTIQPIHVTQTIDALTAADAYDITISGSLTLTGSVSSLNGFTGDLVGTASRATEASITTQVRPSNTVSDFGYTLPYLSGTGSLATMYYSATGPTYNPTTETITSANFEGTASLATTASYVASSPQNYLPNPGGAFVGPGNLGLIAGSTTLSSGVSPAINPTALTGKTFQTQYWVTTTKASGSTSPSPGTLFIEEPTPGGGAFLIKETGASSNDDVNFIIVYLS
jgi:hypothetical protein